MNTPSLKYYSLSIVIVVICICSLVYLGLSSITNRWISDAPYLIKQLISILMSLLSVTTFFYIINNYCFGWLHRLFDLPDLRGTYTGKLISSYHVDDDENKPFISKYVKLTVWQNLNGFYVEAKFYDHEAAVTYSSESYSVSDDIDKKDNGEYIITYRYQNKGNATHDDHKKYKLTRHDGIAILHYHTKDKTLIGKYFNDGQERPSYGELNLILNP